MSNKSHNDFDNYLTKHKIVLQKIFNQLTHHANHNESINDN